VVEKVIIIGHAITAEIFYDYLSRDPNIEVVAFAVHEAYLDKATMFGKPVVAFEKLTAAFPPADYKVINAVGYSNLNKNREMTFLQAKEKGYTVLSYIHPDASNFAKSIGEGVFVMPGSRIEPFATVRDNSIICSNVVIAHHSTIEENCWIASGTVVSGAALVKRNSFLGVNATVVNKVVVGEYNIIGAQTLITKNTASGGVYISKSGEQHRFPSQDYAKHFLA
jgi:sugar O-acyltransferase (sialic acid O-acetyltransferase NeuD family)